MPSFAPLGYTLGNYWFYSSSLCWVDSTSCPDDLDLLTLLQNFHFFLLQKITHHFHLPCAWTFLLSHSFFCVWKYNLLWFLLSPLLSQSTMFLVLVWVLLVMMCRKTHLDVHPVELMYVLFLDYQLNFYTYLAGGKKACF